jgi:hypothetical protein
MKNGGVKMSWECSQKGICCDEDCLDCNRYLTRMLWEQEEKIISGARKLFDGKDFYDWSLIIYALRDLQRTKDLGLRELAWEYHRSQSTTKNEAIEFYNTVKKNNLKEMRKRGPPQLID